jgi:hypothetical protein
LNSNGGTCSPFSFSGTFIQGVRFTDSNTLTVQVTVTTPGSFKITTDTVNGVSFATTDTFTSSGVHAVVLKGTGTPSTSGSHSFGINFGNSTCSFSINFEVPSATGTLGGSSGDCTPVSIFNNTFDAVTIQVNVTSPGPYRIKTDTRNGVTFVNEGAFTSTGLQNVTLSRNGSPIKTSTETFTVTFGSSSCSFTLTFVAFGPDNLFNYFPATAGSFWTYRANPTDSLNLRATGVTKTIDGKIYDVFTTKSSSSTLDSSFYRKSGGEYYQNLIVVNGTPANVDFKFLVENAPVGVPWQAANYLRTLNGVTDTITIEAVISSRKSAETLGSITFNDVIIVGYFYYSKREGQPRFLYQRDEKGFARKVGMIRTGTERVFALRRVRVE